MISEVSGYREATQTVLDSHDSHNTRFARVVFVVFVSEGRIGVLMLCRDLAVSAPHSLGIVALSTAAARAASVLAGRTWPAPTT